MSLPLLTSVVSLYLFIVGYLTAKAYRDTSDASDYMVAGRRIHPLGPGDNHHPLFCFIRFHRKGLTEGANLTDFDEGPGRFHPNDVRMITGLDFAA